MECENCGHRQLTVRTGVGTFCRVCLYKLVHSETWLFDPGLVDVIVQAWRERLGLLRAAGE